MPRYRRPANRVTERIVSEFPDFEGWTDEEKVAATTVSAHFQGVRFETVDNGWGGVTTKRVRGVPSSDGNAHAHIGDKSDIPSSGRGSQGPTREALSDNSPKPNPSFVTLDPTLPSGSERKIHRVDEQDYNTADCHTNDKQDHAAVRKSGNTLPETPSTAFPSDRPNQSAHIPDPLDVEPTENRSKANTRQDHDGLPVAKIDEHQTLKEVGAPTLVGQDTTTRKVEPKPPTQETISYCKQLMDERNGYAQTERLRAWLNRAAKRHCLTQAMVDSAIKSLLEQRGE